MTKPVLKDVLGMVGQTRVEVPVTPKLETARMENTVLGVCPCCSKNMPVVEAGGVPCYVCVDDCVCLPTAD